LDTRILILTPSAFPKVTGNAITTERWQRSLTAKGWSVKVLAADGLTAAAFLDVLQGYGPQLIHVHHAYKAGALLIDPQVQPRIAAVPVVVSPGGTDVHLDVAAAPKKETILSVLQMARIIITQSFETAQIVRSLFPAVAKRIVRVEKAASWFGNDPFDLRQFTRCSSGDIVFFLPAGIRPVKGNLECLLAMGKVYERRRNIRFIAAGPSVDPEYAARFEREVKRLAAFSSWASVIPPAAMRSAYESSDVVLNSSFSEGLSNSLLEAVAAGRPILASNIPGNRLPVLGENEGECPAGLLFNLHDKNDFVQKATDLIDNPQLRNTLGSAALHRHHRIATPEDEAAGLIAAYQTAIQQT
jgi:L-malate glycosyltransferase